jgi:hypothetical protein
MKLATCTLKPAVLTLIALMFVLMGASLTAAQDFIQPDGRLNQVTHFGGDAFYCVDRDFLPTQQYSDFGDGGFRLLNMQGQELMFIPALQISAAVAEAKETGKGVLVGEGTGTYGPVQVYTYVTNENDDYFIFSGYDEYGKPNSIEFKFCIPVGPDPKVPGEPEEDCVIFWSWKAVGAVAQEPCCDYTIIGGQKLLGGQDISQFDECLLW